MKKPEIIIIDHLPIILDVNIEIAKPLSYIRRCVICKGMADKAMLRPNKRTASIPTGNNIELGLGGVNSSNLFENKLSLDETSE